MAHRLHASRRAKLRRTRPILEQLEDRKLLTQLSYTSGPLLTNVQIESVFLGTGWQSQPAATDLTTRLNGFLGNLVTGPYMGLMSEYGIGTGNFIGSPSLPTSGPSGGVWNDSAIQTSLRNLLDQRSIPSPGNNTLYSVFTPPGVVVTLQGPNGPEYSPQDFLGYHQQFSYGGILGIGASSVYYAVITNTGTPQVTSANESLAFTSDTWTASHEIAEAVTDPRADYTGYVDNNHSDWISSKAGGEIGDLVENLPGGPLLPFLGPYQPIVTPLWSNSARGAVSAYDMYIGPSGGDWDIPSNWLDQRIPTSPGGAYIPSGVTVNHSGSSNEMVNQIYVSSGAILNITNGSISTNKGQVTINGVLNLGYGGSLSGSGSVTINGALNWTGGEQDGPGTTLIAPGGVLNVTGTNGKVINRSLNNQGTINWNGGSFYMYNGATLDNQAGGTLNETVPQAFFYGGGSVSTVRNEGIYNYNNAGTATLLSGVVFNNSGTLNVLSGTFNPEGGGTNTGNFNLAVSTAQLLFNNANGYTFAYGSELFGPGQVLVSGSLTVPTPLTWTGGEQDGPGTTLIAPGGVLNISGTNGKVLSNRRLNNQGSINWSGGSFYMYNGATLDNQAGGALAETAPLSFLNGGGGNSTVQNEGIYAYTGTGTATFQSGVVFNNSYILVIGSSGIFNPQGSGTNTGIISLSNTATSSGEFLDSGPNGYTFGPGAAMSGSGSIIVTGRLTISSGSAFTLSYGFILGGTGTVTVNPNGILNWTGGEQDGPGTTLIAPGGVLNVTGTNGKVINRSLNNQGTINWNGGSFYMYNGATLDNQAGGTLNETVPQAFFYGGGSVSTVRNEGIYNYNNAGTATLLSGVVFNNSGTLNVLSGTFNPEGGGTNSNRINLSSQTKLLLNSANPYAFSTTAVVSGSGFLAFQTSGVLTLSNGPTISYSTLVGGSILTINGRRYIVVASGNEFDLSPLS